MHAVLDYRSALRDRSGVGEWVHELGRHVAAQLGPDDSLTLFSASWRDRLDPSAVPGARTVDRRVPVRLLNFAWHRLEWPPIERLAGRSFDVVHSAHPLLTPARSGAKFITIHDLDFLDHPARSKREIRRDYPALARTHAQRASRIVVVSRTTAREVEQRLSVDPARIVLCPGGAPEWAAAVRQDVPKRHVLFLGTLEARKNLDGLLDAWTKVIAAAPDVPPLVIAGRPTADAAAASARMQQAPLSGHVRHLGYVSNAEREALYRDAAVLVVPSLHEGFGLTALEAMAAGVPVVASHRGSLPELVGDAALLVDPLDADAIARALLTVLSDPDVRARLSTAGRRRAAAYSWAESARGLIAAYRAAASERQAG
ncbi:MAG: glycosyltransferase family 1 protein [Vicinamibacterales bacterium]